ncbi:exosortase family protein XrtG [Bacillus sp. CGMCC 1.60114]|uniref:exosortase family protein XrtG n=1 Tax=unclassified Bacillus (in: firmicutes) TaxID=185979 RepID=UPI00362D3428
MITFIIGLFLFCICIFGAFFLSRIGLAFFAFLVGSVGFFTVGMIYLLPYIEPAINGANSYIMNQISKILPYFHVTENLSLITIPTKEGIVTMILNYECSGGIELLVFLSLVLFFPFGNIKTKLLSTFGGLSFLFIANIGRLLFIIAITKWFGAPAYYIAHTVLARILFFGLTIYIYYKLFTVVQLRYQQVGELK